MKIEIYIYYGFMKRLREILRFCPPLQRWWRSEIRRFFAYRAGRKEWGPMYIIYLPPPLWYRLVNLEYRFPIHRCAICNKWVLRKNLFQGYCPECVRDLNDYYYGTLESE